MFTEFVCIDAQSILTSRDFPANYREFQVQKVDRTGQVEEPIPTRRRGQTTERVIDSPRPKVRREIGFRQEPFSAEWTTCRSLSAV